MNGRLQGGLLLLILPLLIVAFGALMRLANTFGRLLEEPEADRRPNFAEALGTPDYTKQEARGEDTEEERPPPSRNG